MFLRIFGDKCSVCGMQARDMIQASATEDAKASLVCCACHEADSEVKAHLRAEMEASKLVAAAITGDADAVRALLTSSAKLDPKRKRDVIIEASKAGHLEVVRALLEAGIRKSDGETALIVAAWRGHLEIVRALLEAGADVNAKGFLGKTAIAAASEMGHVDVVRTLLSAGADVGVIAADGATPLICASLHQHLEVVRALLKAGADANAKRSDGETALIVAAWRGHLEIVRVLLEAGADVNAEGATENTAFEIALENSDFDMVQAMVTAGARLRVGREEHQLICGSSQGDIQAVQAKFKRGVLLSRHAVVQAINIARKGGLTAMVSLLYQSGKVD
jgi:ankyrin repeat protein